MGYRDIYKESNEQAEERFSLVMERIAEIAEETDVPEKFDDYFKKTAAIFVTVKECVRESGERYIKRCFSYRVRKTECRIFMMTSKRKIMEKVMEIRLMQ